MKELAEIFPKAEVIADFRGVHKQKTFSSGREDIVQLLKRRPCSAADIADGLGMHQNEVLKYLDQITAEGLLEQNQVAGKPHYRYRSERTSQKHYRDAIAKT